MLFLILSVQIIIIAKYIKAKVNDTPPFKICLDPGHGGFDGGTKYENILEKDIVLNFTLELAAYLRMNGYIVCLTRNVDEALGKTKAQDMHKRMNIINDSNANIYISIHANNYPSEKVHGAQVFYNDKFKENKQLAKILMDNIKLVDRNNIRDIHTIKDKYITDNATIPGCLVELGFLSNKSDLNNLLSKKYINDLAKILTLGIVEYLDYLK